MYCFFCNFVLRIFLSFLFGLMVGIVVWGCSSKIIIGEDVSFDVLFSFICIVDD